MRYVLRKASGLWKKLERRVADLLFKSRVSHVGSGARLSLPICIIGGRHITVGCRFSSGPGLRLEAWERHNDVCYEPTIAIGDDVSFGWNCHVGAIGKITIGNKCLFGSGVLITDHNHGNSSMTVSLVELKDAPLVAKGPVEIEDGVWVGEHACILSGVRIGRGAIVGANAVVTRDVPSGAIVGGIPAKVIGQRPL